jgi:hypothetical protein
MRRIFASFVTVAAVTLAGCSLDLTNPNNPTLGSALTNPRAATSQMIDGVIATYRDNRATQIRAFGSFGRETYYMFITDGRFITGPYHDWRLNNSFEAGTQWAVRYGNYRNAYAAIQIVNSTTALTGPEKAGALGVLETFIALDLLHVIEARGAIGAVVDMTADVNAVLPIVSEDSVYKWISAKLDEAKGNLDTAGASFYFPMHSGFSDFAVAANKPAGFIQFNRALKARVEAKRGSLGCGAPCYARASTALDSTWVADLTAANRDNGVYVIYSTASGDRLNGASYGGDPNFYVHPSIDSIAGVAQDDRYRRKVALITSACDTAYIHPQTEVGVTATHRACTYPTNVSPIPIIRNEELILLAAEANWFAATGSKSTAITDLNFIRANSGGLAATTVTTGSTDSVFVNELLKQRFYSLLYEGGHRWIDMRRFGRLGQIINDRPTWCASPSIPADKVFSHLPINSFEVQARQ